MPAPEPAPVNRLLIVMPTWVGDTVMAMPTLRALRLLYPEAHISALARQLVKPVVEGCPWVDRIVTYRRAKKKGGSRRGGMLHVTRMLSAGKFDTAVLLPNSFRTALLARMVGITRRVGYDRDGRGFLLTDRLLARRRPGKGYVPVSTRDYYLGIARYMGALHPDPTMSLFTTPQDDRRALEMLRGAGFDPDGPRKLVLINPGANYGESKLWYPERFAAVADRCARELGAAVAITGAPRERPILDQVLSAAREPIIDLPRLGLDLGVLKSVVKRSSLMVTNDTGPRHFAIALGVPVVTVFGPTDPRWTETYFEQERQVRVDVFCGPCQKKKCPLVGADGQPDHRCMKLVEPDMVFQRVTELLNPVPA